MRKKILMILSIVTVLSMSMLAGCDSEQDTDSTVAQQPTVMETSTAATEAEETQAPTSESTQEQTSMSESEQATAPTSESTETQAPTTGTSTETSKPTQSTEPAQESTQTQESTETATTIPEPAYTRDSVYVLTGIAGNVSDAECVIEYDSSKVSYQLNDIGPWYSKYEFTGDKVTLFCADEEMGACGIPVIRSGCTSYENYKNYLKEKFIAKGVPETALWFEEYGSYSVNGYTYYMIEYGYMTEDDIDNETRIYVQISDNEYIEVCNACLYSSLEEFINTVFYISEVK